MDAASLDLATFGGAGAGAGGGYVSTAHVHGANKAGAPALRIASLCDTVHDKAPK